MDEAHEIAPLVPLLHGGEEALPVDRPGRVQDRFEPDAVFVDGPQLDNALRKCRGHLA
jgi:hypothetical protein